MLRRIVQDEVSRIQPETVDVEFIHPIYGIFREQLADGLCARRVQIKCCAPWRVMGSVEVVIGICAHVVSVGSEMVVNDIQDDGYARCMRGIHEGSESIRSPVGSRWRVNGHTVVTPVP